MTAPEPLIFACSCEGTMPLDEAALAAGCGGALHKADQLCRRELDRFRRAVASGAAVTVGCTQEAPLFSEVAGESGAAERVRFANVREFGGWSNEAEAAGPKMAALLAAAAEPVPPVSLVVLAALVWLWVARRQREARKHEGLRVLR